MAHAGRRSRGAWIWLWGPLRTVPTPEAVASVLASVAGESECAGCMAMRRSMAQLDAMLCASRLPRSSAMHGMLMHTHHGGKAAAAGVSMQMNDVTRNAAFRTLCSEPPPELQE